MINNVASYIHIRTGCMGYSGYYSYLVYLVADQSASHQALMMTIIIKPSRCLLSSALQAA